MPGIAKFSAWLLFISYLLIGFGGVVSAAIYAEGESSGCVQSGPGERCCESCGEESSPSHLRSSPAAKRLLQITPVPSAFRGAETPSLHKPKVASAHRHALLPNPTLTALRTVVLLN